MKNFFNIFQGIQNNSPNWSEDTSPSVDDLVVTINDPTGTPQPRFVTLQNLFQSQGYFDRGDPAAWDYQVGDLTTDGAWHDMDLSAIVPVGAIMVKMTVIALDNANSLIQFRKNGNANDFNIQRCYASNDGATSKAFGYDIGVFCDTDRVIEYLADNVVWGSINIVVTGWYI